MKRINKRAVLGSGAKVSVEIYHSPHRRVDAMVLLGIHARAGSSQPAATIRLVREVTIQLPSNLVWRQTEGRVD